MDKVKHEINAALSWLEEGNVERAKLHLGFALAHLGDEEAQQSVHPTNDGLTHADSESTPAVISG